MRCRGKFHFPLSVLSYKWHMRMQVRFLLPVLPLFNVLAAAGLVRLAQSRSKSPTWAGAHAAAVAALAATLAATVLMTAASRRNYPGGHALARLHALGASQADAARQQGAQTSLAASIPSLPACRCS